MFATFPFDPADPFLVVGRDEFGRFFVAVPAPEVDLDSLRVGSEFEAVIVSIGDPLAELLFAPPDLLALEDDEQPDEEDWEDYEDEDGEGTSSYGSYDPDRDGGDGFPDAWPRYGCCGHPVDFSWPSDGPCPHCGAA